MKIINWPNWIFLASKQAATVSLFVFVAFLCYRPLSASAQKTSELTNKLAVDITIGPSHINPSFVLWIEDFSGKFLRTVFVTKSVGTGVYQMAQKTRGRWKKGPVYIEGALPVWAHRRGVRNKEGGFTPMPETALPDAYSGATPMEHSRIYIRVNLDKLKKFRLFFEINQSHDFNDYFTEELNEEENLQSVGQPSIVYGKLIDLTSGQKKFKLLPLGYGDFAGQTGELYRGFDKFDTALWLIKSIEVSLRN